MSVNKFELIEAIAKSADISKAAAGRALDGAVAAIESSLKKGGMVTLVGFGTFYVGKRASLNRIAKVIARRQPQSLRRSEMCSAQAMESKQRCGTKRFGI
jgi:nucleoid DNA-binding protein